MTCRGLRVPATNSRPSATAPKIAVLLAGALATAEGRRFVLDRTCTPERFGEQMARSVRLRLDDADPVTMADLLIGGVLKSELETPRSPSLRWQALDEDDLVLAPLPNTLFQRDNSAWIASGVTVNPMAKLARQRESVHTRAVYRFHPLFRDAQFDRYYGDDDRDHRPATLEGGDVLVLAPGVVLIGMGERTTPTAVELLARRLFTATAYAFCVRGRTQRRPSASNGATATTTSHSNRVSWSATTATWRPTACSKHRASRCWPSRVESSDAAAGERGA